MREGAAQDLEEPKLIRKAFRGDAAAFQTLVETHQSAVYNLCFRFVGPADAEDFAQETFIRAFLHKEKFQQDRPVLPWLLTVARNLCIDKVRGRRYTASIDDTAVQVASNEPGPDAEIHRKQQAALLSEMMQSLPEGQREALMLTDVEDLTYQETADVLDVPIGTVMTWLHRGRAKLKETFVRREKQTEHRFFIEGVKR